MTSLSKEKLLKQIQKLLPEGYQFVILLIKQIDKNVEISSFSSITPENAFRLAVDFAKYLKIRLHRKIKMSATIEDLLGVSAEKIASMSDDELREYLKDIIKLELQAIPSPLSSSSSLNSKDKEEEKDSCPIKSAKKKKKKLSGNELLEKLAKDIEEL